MMKLTKFFVPVSIFFGLLLFYLLCLNHVEPSEGGIAKDSITGNLYMQPAGWHLTQPWVRVTCIDTRPVRVSVQSAGRAVSGKLVRFIPEKFKEFIALEGFRYYWFSNRFSINFGHKEEFRGMRDILRGYAFSPKKQPFIEVIEEYGE